MAREPLSSPLQRRSQYLAEALKAMRQEPQRIGGYGDLAARLAAQALTQAAAEKTDKAAGAEASNAELARRQAIFGGIPGLDVGGEMQDVGNGRLGNPLSGLARAVRGFGRGGEQPAPQEQAAPPPAQPPQMPMASVGAVQNSGSMPPVGQMQDPAPQATPMQSGAAQLPPDFIQQAQRFLALGTPEGEQQALALVQGWQQQQQILASIPPELRGDPKFMFAAQNNPEALAESLGYQYRPQVIAAGGVQSVIGSGDRVSAPQTIQFGDTLTRVDPLSPTPQTIATRGPTFAEQTGRIAAERPQAVTTATGADTRLIGPNGEVIDEFAGRDAPRSQQQIPPRAAELTGQIRALETDVFPTLDRQRSLLASGEVITGPFAQQRLATARVLAEAGNEQARREVAATEEYIANAGRLRVGMAKSLGTNPSNADIQLLDIVTAGDITKSQDGLMATLDQGYALADRQRSGFQGELLQYDQVSQQNGPVSVSTEDEYRRLPRGTRYIAPDGQVRTKQ